jgi:hypothetical protein
MRRKCDVCGIEYAADERNIKRGWGLCCSKSCAAKKREKKKPGYDTVRVAQNNVRRANWNNPESMPLRVKIDRNFRRYGIDAPNIVGGSGVISGMTSEGYRIMDGTAYDEWDNPVYDVGIGEYDKGDSEYWENSDNGHE